MNPKELGNYLKAYREGLGYSTYDINKLCDISPGYISLIENGKRNPSPVILKKLAPIYSLDYVDLLEKAGYIDLAEKEKITNSYNSNIENITNSIEKRYGNNSTKLLNYYEKLNDAGKDKAIENVKDLTEVPKYIEKKTDIQEA